MALYKTIKINYKIYFLKNLILKDVIKKKSNVPSRLLHDNCICLFYFLKSFELARPSSI